MINRGSTVSKADIQAVLTDLIEVSYNVLLMGGRVNIEGLVQLFSSVEGVFNDSTDSFDPLRHKLNIAAQSARQLSDRLRSSAVMEKDSAPTITVKIIQVIDTYTANTNSTLSLTRIINIVGEKLKFDSTRADEGLFIANDTTTTETKIISNLITLSTDTKINFQADFTATAGNSVYIEIRTRMGNKVTYPLKIATSTPLTVA